MAKDLNIKKNITNVCELVKIIIIKIKVKWLEYKYAHGQYKAKVYVQM